MGNWLNFQDKQEENRSQLSVHFKLEQNFLLLKRDQLSWFAWDGEVSWNAAGGTVIWITVYGHKCSSFIRLHSVSTFKAFSFLKPIHMSAKIKTFCHLTILICPHSHYVVLKCSQPLLLYICPFVFNIEKSVCKGKSPQHRFVCSTKLRSSLRFFISDGN